LPAALSQPPAKPRRTTLAIVATASGTLLVGAADALIEFSPEGKQLRTIAEVKDSLALAVGRAARSQSPLRQEMERFMS